MASSDIIIGERRDGPLSLVSPFVRVCGENGRATLDQGQPRVAARLQSGLRCGGPPLIPVLVLRPGRLDQGRRRRQPLDQVGEAPEQRVHGRVLGDFLGDPQELIVGLAQRLPSSSQNLMSAIWILFLTG